MKSKIDIQGIYFHYYNHIQSIVITSFTSLLTRFFCIIKGVKLGEYNKFNGITHFSQKKYSSIIIGNCNRFNSRKKSNLIGINHSCIISTLSISASIKLGDNCGFSGTIIGAAQRIELGNDILCGANTVITDTDWHAVEPNLRKTGKAKTNPVKIEDNVWLGYGVVVLKGVTIGENSIITPLSVVVNDIPANVIAGGNPCRIIKPL